MKYILVSLTALTLFTGVASADNQKVWPCIDLHANWVNAPKMQCRHIFTESREQIVAAPAPTPEPPPVEVVDDIPK